MARSLLPSLQTFLSQASDEQMRGALLHIRGIIDGLLLEGGADAIQEQGGQGGSGQGIPGGE